MYKNKDRYLDSINIAIVILISIIMLYPFWQTVVASFMSETEYLASKLKLYVKAPTLAAYKQIFVDGRIFTHLRVTFLITIVGTITALFFTTYSAYGLSKSFRGSRIIMVFVVMTIFIDVGLIPVYLNYKDMGLINTFPVYIIPYSIHTYFLIIIRATFMKFPVELEEAAKIEGCNYFGIFFRIVLPLSKPILAAIGLFLAVNFWNTYLQSVFFTTKQSLKTVQEYLNKIISDTNDLSMILAAESEEEGFSAETVRLANVVIALLPIVSLYPFLQKHFMGGLMMGSLKG